MQENIIYILDDQDTIIEVSDGWDTFASNNNGHGCLGTHVVGRNLFDFINGDVTRMFVRTLLQSVRLRNKPVTRQYRCDSPHVKRFMELYLTRDGHGHIIASHRLVKEEPKKYGVDFKLARPSNVNTLARCSMCDRLKVRGRWLESDEAAEYQLIAQQGDVMVIYAICHRCMSNVGSPSAIKRINMGRADGAANHSGANEES